MTQLLIMATQTAGISITKWCSKMMLNEVYSYISMQDKSLEVICHCLLPNLFETSQSISLSPYLLFWNISPQKGGGMEPDFHCIYKIFSS